MKHEAADCLRGCRRITPAPLDVAYHRLHANFSSMVLYWSLDYNHCFSRYSGSIWTFCGDQQLSTQKRSSLSPKQNASHVCYKNTNTWRIQLFLILKTTIESYFRPINCAKPSCSPGHGFPFLEYQGHMMLRCIKPRTVSIWLIACNRLPNQSFYIQSRHILRNLLFTSIEFITQHHTSGHAHQSALTIPASSLPESNSYSHYSQQ